MLRELTCLRKLIEKHAAMPDMSSKIPQQRCMRGQTLQLTNVLGRLGSADWPEDFPFFKFQNDKRSAGWSSVTPDPLQVLERQ